MAQGTTASALDIVQAIAEVVQRHGQHDFPFDTEGHFTKMASLCGLTVYFDGAKVKRIKTHDMDLTCDHAPSRIRHIKHSLLSHLSFQTGSLSHLDKWHQKILQFDSFFVLATTPLPALAQAA